MLIPVYNRHQLVAGAIESALAQEVADLDIVVVDNHSDDGTWELLQTYRDPRLKVVRNVENLGLFGNFNRSGQYASGHYTLYLCSDDRLTNGFLQQAVGLMESNPQAALLSSRGRYVDLDGYPRSVIGARLEPGVYEGLSIGPTWFWASYFLGTNIFNYPSGILIRTSILSRCLPFDGTLGAPADVDMFLRILEHGDLVVCDSIGCFVTEHEGQQTNIYRSSADLLRQNFILLERYRPKLEAIGAYERLSRQIATLVLTTIVRTMRIDIKAAAELYSEFQKPIALMLSAAANRIITRLQDRFGTLKIPYLNKRGNDPVPHRLGQ